MQINVTTSFNKDEHEQLLILQQRINAENVGKASKAAVIKAAIQYMLSTKFVEKSC